MKSERPEAPSLKPRLRGVSHQIAFFVFLPLGVALTIFGGDGLTRLAAVVFAVSVAAMFGASALYHRSVCSPAAQRRLRRLDHAAIFGLIAGTYTPFGLLVLSGAWRITVLSIVWGGALAAMVLKLVWLDGPNWLTALLGVALGWVGVAAFPEMLDELGISASLLLVAGGIAYTAGAIVYALRKPDPLPGTFGYHEVFHALVIVAVALQYVVVSFYILPSA